MISQHAINQKSKNLLYDNEGFLTLLRLVALVENQLDGSRAYDAFSANGWVNLNSFSLLHPKRNHPLKFQLTRFDIRRSYGTNKHTDWLPNARGLIVKRFVNCVPLPRYQCLYKYSKLGITKRRPEPRNLSWSSGIPQRITKYSKYSEEITF